MSGLSLSPHNITFSQTNPDYYTEEEEQEEEEEEEEEEGGGCITKSDSDQGRNDWLGRNDTDSRVLVVLAFTHIKQEPEMRQTVSVYSTIILPISYWNIVTSLIVCCKNKFVCFFVCFRKNAVSMI